MVWPVNMRRLYAEDFCFVSTVGESYQMLHEWTIIQVSNCEYFAIIAILGIEYAINLARPNLEGFHLWLTEHADKSPFYD
jgi:hypothetical protein